MSLLVSVHYLRYQTHRHLEERFNINAEMRTICFVTFLMSLMDYYEYNVAVSVLQAIKHVVVLFVSNFLPCLKSWDDSYEIDLTPEVIHSFDLSISHKLCMNSFKQFLQSVSVKESIGRVEGLVESENRVFSIDTEADSEVAAQAGDVYLWFIISVYQLEDRPSLKQARRLYKQYFKPSLRLFTRETMTEVESKFQLCQEATTHEEDIVSLFSTAKDYALELLRGIYYSRFVKSPYFARLKREVEINLKRKQRDQLHFLEGSEYRYEKTQLETRLSTDEG